MPDSPLSASPAEDAGPTYADVAIAYEINRMLDYIAACDRTILTLNGTLARERTARATPSSSHATGAPPKSQVRYNAERDPMYCPYCMRCDGLVRMQIVEPFYWRCFCGAEHDERAAAPPVGGAAREETLAVHEQNQGWTEKSATSLPFQPQEPEPKGESSPHGVRQCRGHWHVTSDLAEDAEDLAISGDPFPHEASALAAAARLDALDAETEMRDLSESAAASFFAFESKLAPNCYCPSCNALRAYSYTGGGCCPRGLSHSAMCVCGGTMQTERAPVPASDRSRSTTQDVATQALTPRAPVEADALGDATARTHSSPAGPMPLTPELVEKLAAECDRVATLWEPVQECIDEAKAALAKVAPPHNPDMDRDGLYYPLLFLVQRIEAYNDAE